MGVASEAVDDCLVPEFEIVAVVQPEGGKELFGVRVNDAGLTVHERHVQKRSLLTGESLIVRSGHSLLRQDQGHRIARESFRRLAEEIARELVQDDDFGEAPAGRRTPLKQFAQCGSCLLYTSRWV